MTTSPPSDDVHVPARESRRAGAGRGLALGALVALLGIGGGVLGYLISDRLDIGSGAATKTVTVQQQSMQPSNDTASSGGGGSSDAETPSSIYKRVAPSVVHIESESEQTTTGFFGIPQTQQQKGTGSGFLIDTKGHIVTNAHVVDGSQKLTVTFGQDGATVPAKLVGEDKSSDIAVIKIDPSSSTLTEAHVDITPVEWGDSATLQVGDPVLAIGNPFGLDRTLTTGVVSALQRNIPALNDFSISNAIQTDAAVNPGNSGGPLLNAAGGVVGVNSQIESKSGGFDGIAFAVPSARVKNVAKQLIDDGKVTYAWLGVQGGAVTPDVIDQYDLKVDHGVFVAEVTKDSPADKAGIRGAEKVSNMDGSNAHAKGGDVLLSFDGEELTSMTQLGSLVDGKKPGDKVEVKLQRGSDTKTVTITLGNRDSVDTTRTDVNGG